MKTSIQRRTALVASSALLGLVAAGFTAGSAQAALPSWTDPSPSGEITSLTFRFNIRGSDYPYFKSGYPSSDGSSNAAAGAAGNWCGSSVCFQLGTPSADAGWSVTSVSKVNKSGEQFDLDVVVSAAAGTGAKDAFVNVFATPNAVYQLTGGGFPMPVFYNQAIWSGYVWADTPAPDAPWIGYCTTACANIPATTGDRYQKLNLTTFATGTTFECSLDDAPFVSCSGPIGDPYIVGPLADGPHSLASRATKNGYVSTVSKVTWTVDGATVSAPAKPILSGAPAALTNQASASISFSSEGATSYTCSVDGGAYSACTSPKSLTGLADGAHSLAVKATNTGGTSDAATASWTVSSQPTGTPQPTTPSTAPAKTLSGSYSLWTIKAGLIFKAPADQRPAAQYMTLQVSTSVFRPSNSQPVPTRPTYADGILAWSPTGTVTRSGLPPRWIRVGNRAGKWTGWVALRR